METPDKPSKKSKGRARRCLTDEEIEMLSRHFDTAIERDEKGLKIRDYTLIFTALNTGMRIGEILAWDVGDVWDGRRVLESSLCDETKTNRVRVIELQDNLQDILTAYIQDKGYQEDEEKPLFRSINGQRLGYRQALNIFQGSCKAAGIRIDKRSLIGCHSARKTYAKEALAAGNNNYSNLQKALGHSSIKSTYAYITFNTQEVSEMINKVNFS